MVSFKYESGTRKEELDEFVLVWFKIVFTTNDKIEIFIK